MNEHLLLVSLGTSPGAVLALMEKLNQQGPPLTDLWIVTTASQQIVSALDRSIRTPLRDPAYQKLRWHVLVLRERPDIRTADDHSAMSELLFRLALAGMHWRGPDSQGRRFSVGLVGGRKTMSAVLQQAAGFLAADAVYHVVFEGEDKDAPGDLSGVRARLGQQHLVAMSAQRQPWFEMLRGPWNHRFPNKPLEPPSFPIENWEPTLASGVRHVTAATSPSLQESLNGIATLAGIFASPESLAAGMGGQFLRHDMRNLLGNLARTLPDNPVVQTMSAYVLGLRQLMEPATHNLASASFPWNDFRALCDSALLLAVGQQAPDLVIPNTIRVHLEGLPNLAGWTSSGISRELFLVAMRNLFANVCAHGKSEGEWLEPTVTIRLTRDDRKILCRVSNPVPMGKIEGLAGAASPDGSLPRLLEPRFKIDSKDGEGLGLFTLRQVANRTDGAVLLRDPQLLPWPSEQPDFAITLEFARNQEAP